MDLNPVKVAALTKVTNECLSDSLNMREMLAAEFAGSFAGEITRAALVGDCGEGEPVGIANYSNIALNFLMGTSGSSFQTGPSTGATSSGSSYWWPLLAVISAIRQNNANPNAMILSPREMVELADIVDENKQPIMMPQLLSKMAWYDTGLFR